jgi:putative oxidoreductase
MMLVHGIPKILNYQTMLQQFPDPIGLGNQLGLNLTIGAEVGCSILLILGALTRLAAIPLAFTMGVALFVVHAADAWDKKELAAVFLAIYVVLVVAGPGRFSVDGCCFCRRKSHGDEPISA